MSAVYTKKTRTRVNTSMEVPDDSEWYAGVDLVTLMDGLDDWGLLAIGGGLDFYSRPHWVFARYNLLTDPELCALCDWAGPLHGDMWPQLGILPRRSTYLNIAPR